MRGVSRRQAAGVVAAALASALTSPHRTSVAADADRFVTPWTPARQRVVLRALEFVVLDHNGRQRVLSGLCDRPTLLTFFYTRCENASKCSTTMSQLAAMQARLARDGIDQRVRLIALSHEPAYDTPERLHSFATNRGLRLGEMALAAAVQGGRHERLVEELGTPVNFNAGWVNTHGIQAVLLDARGRPVRRYSTLLWDNEAALADLKTLLSESTPR